MPLQLLAAISAAALLSDLTKNTFREGTLRAGDTVDYRLWLSTASQDIKIVLLPLSGDTDVIASFDSNATAFTDSSGKVWSLTGTSVKELLLRRDVFCANSQQLRLPPPSSCFLYLRVVAYSQASFKVGVLDAQDPFSRNRECASGCPPPLLANDACDLKCNTTACAFDRGACLSTDWRGRCSGGCADDWLGDGFCDDSCFTEGCEWDLGDCAETDMEGCADKCLSEYIDDGECDLACNVAACMWDGSDCSHGHDECYEQAAGEDYRGAANVTSSGVPCQRWSAQLPQQHFFTHARYPTAGLGAHAACRNPGGVNAGPWCYTTDPRIRWERCTVPPPSQNGCTERKSHVATGARGQSQCERICPSRYALIVNEGECEAADDCGCEGGGCRILADQASQEPCAVERRECERKRATTDKLRLVLWLCVAGTSFFVFSLVWHAYQLTSPLGSPRLFASGGYTGVETYHSSNLSPSQAGAGLERSKVGVICDDEAHAQRQIRAQELQAAEQAIVDELVE
jgi:hypothetical protein